MRLLSLVLIAVCSSFAAAVKCHSCLTHCRTTGAGTVNAQQCDCLSSEQDQCEANACFAKVELFSDEKTAILQKGCISDVPGGMEGCQYASNSETLHCFCTGDKCNVRQKMNDFLPAKLPTIECCACSEKHGEKCSHDQCPRKCTGNYCVVDFDGLEQGCGLGFPRLHSFLRMPKYTDWQGKPICARYEATANTVMNGCTCTSPSGHCNEFNKTRTYQIQRVIERASAEQNYCYSLSYKSSKPFGQEVFKKSTTCEGQYCFISYTTSEIVLESAEFEHDYADHDEFIGTSRPRYEILAGCLKIDDDQKLSVGCTTEYSKNTTDPLAKHCICQSHLCNFHHLLMNATDSRPRGTLRTSTASTAPVSPTTSTSSNVVPPNSVLVPSHDDPLVSPSSIPLPSLLLLPLLFLIRRP